MAEQRNAARLGAVLILVFGLFLAILLWLPGATRGGATVPFRVRFPQGLPLPTLDAGSKVLVAGRPVGTVTHLSFEQMDREYYLVVAGKIDNSIPLRRDCKIRAVGEVLGGVGSLVVDIGTDPQPADLSVVLDGAPPGGFGAYLEALGKELDGANPKSLLGRIKTQLDADQAASLVAKLHKSLDDLNAISHGAAVQLDPAQQASLIAKLHVTLDHVNATTAALRGQLAERNPDAILGKVHVALDSLNAGLRTTVAMLDENRRPIADTLSHVQSTAAKVDTRIVENIARETDASASDSLMAKLHQTVNGLNTSLKDMQIIAKTAREVVVLNKENLNRTLSNFKQTSDHLKAAAREVRARPWVLLREPSVTDLKEQAIYEAARNFSDAASRLDDAAAQLKTLAELHNGAVPGDDKDLVAIRAQLEETFARFKQAEDGLWQKLNVRP
ncbi:MAG: hypothetical protein U1A27_05375 [Phycisphaerae bacterium]